jgi:hypothetical protein
MKPFCGTVVLACTPFVGAGNEAVYPTEKVAAFVFEKVDVTSFPSTIRPKPVKGKKTAIWDLRVRDQANAEQGRQPVPTSIFA